MRLQTCWNDAAECTLVLMVREPDQIDGILRVSCAQELQQDEHNVCVYDEKNYNMLEWALTNGYFETFEEMLQQLLIHAESNPQEIGLLLEMIYEAMCLTSVADEMADYDDMLVAALEELKGMHGPDSSLTYQPGD